METVFEPERLLVVGCGGIGGVIAATLAEQGRKVSCVAHREEIATALRYGPLLRDEHGERRVRGELTVHVEPPSEGAFDFVLLATPPNQVEQAARRALPLLAENGALVCLQNGLCEERVAAIAGPERVLGAIVSWGASSPGPAVYERTSSGGFTMGAFGARTDARLERLSRVLETVGPVEITDNLRGARWSKLAFNCAISTLGTIAGTRLGAIIVHRFVRRLALEVMSEAVAVARAEGVVLSKIAGSIDLDWLALTDSERRVVGSASLLAKHSLMLAVGARYRRLRSSMLAAIERGREPPVDYLNGEIVTRGARFGIPTPLNAALVKAVKDIAGKRTRSSMDALRAIREGTAASV